jgi:hypothetical protein
MMPLMLLIIAIEDYAIAIFIISLFHYAFADTLPATPLLENSTPAAINTPDAVSLFSPPLFHFHFRSC